MGGCWKLITIYLYTWYFYVIVYIILFYAMLLHVFFLFFSWESLSTSRFRIPFSYFCHSLRSSSSLQRFQSQRNPDSAGHPNCTLLPATSKGLWLALKSVRKIIVNCDYVVKFYTKWSITLVNHWRFLPSFNLHDLFSPVFRSPGKWKFHKAFVVWLHKGYG